MPRSCLSIWSTHYVQLIVTSLELCDVVAITQVHQFLFSVESNKGIPLVQVCSMLFLQFVMERWEQQIHDLGIGKDMNDRHLSNFRSADAILLLATSEDDAICMFEILTLEFAESGFIHNTKLTKEMTTQAHYFYTKHILCARHFREPRRCRT